MKRSHALAVAVSGLVLGVATPAVLSLSPVSAATAVKPSAALKALIPSPFVKGAAQAPNTFTGDANEWGVGIVAGASEALVYLCDGVNVGQWFGASIKKGSLVGTAPNGSVVKASLKSGAWSGTVSLRGKPVAFTAKAATTKNALGVWRADPSPIEGPGYVLGWISSAKGLRGISQTAAGSVKTGVVATADKAILNGVDVTAAAENSTATTAAPQAIRITTPGATTAPPDTTKLCLGKTLALRGAIKALLDISAAGSGTTLQQLDDADAAIDAARNALVACLAGR